jgi:hypothetical protein
VPRSPHLSPTQMRASTCNQLDKSPNNKVMQAMISVMTVSNPANGGTLQARPGFACRTFRTAISMVATSTSVSKFDSNKKIGP